MLRHSPFCCTLGVRVFGSIAEDFFKEVRREMSSDGGRKFAICASIGHLCDVQSAVSSWYRLTKARDCSKGSIWILKSRVEATTLTER